MSKYPLCEQFGFPITGGGPMSPYIKARQVEEFLAKAKVAFGMGNENSGVIAFGSSCPENGKFEIKALVINIEPLPKQETAEELLQVVLDQVGNTLHPVLVERIQKALK